MKIYNSTFFNLIILILILSLFNAYGLTWQELIRLFFIFACIIFFYVRDFRKYFSALYINADSGIIKLRDESVKEQRKLAVFTAILFIFIISQFDPATSYINRLVTIEKFNWYFITTLAISIIFAILFSIIFLRLKKIENFKSHGLIIDFDSGDKFVLFIFCIVSVLGFISRLLLSRNPDWENYYFVELKLFQYCIFWFTIKYSILTTVKFKNRLDRIGYSFIPIKRINKIYVGLLTLLFLTIAIGGFRFFNLYELFKEAKSLSIKQGEPEKAIVLNNELLDKNNIFNLSQFDNACLENLATIYIKMDSVKKLNEIIRIIKNVNEGNEKIEERLGNIYYKVNKLELAQKEYERFLEKGFVDENVIERLGRCYVANRNISGIIQLINEYNYLPSIQSGIKDDYILIGNSFIETNHLDLAMEYFENALRLDSDDSYVYYKIGKIYFYFNSYDFAIQKFKKAVELDSSFADAYYRLGLCYEKKGDKKRALKLFEKTVEILPNHFDGLIKIKEYYDVSLIDAVLYYKYYFKFNIFEVS